MKHVLALLLVLLAGGSPAFAQRFVKTANSWADLLSLNPNDVHTNAFVVYGTTVGDEKGGVFTYFSSSSEATNLQNVFKPYAYNGRWIKQIGNFLTNTYVTNLYASNIYTTNLTVINLTTNYVSTNVTVDTLTVTNFVGESTNITINGVYVIVPNFDPNQFSVLPTATPPMVDVAIKSAATVTNLISHNWLVADDSFAMGATPGTLSATAATNLVPTTSSWVDVTSNSAVPGDRILQMNIGTYNGQLLVIKNAPGGNTFTLPNSSTVSGGGQVNLRGTSWTAEPDESILLIYDEAFQDWYEIGRFGTSAAGLVANLTPGYLPYATGTNTLGDSPFYRMSQTTLGFGTFASTQAFLVNSNSNIKIGEAVMTNLQTAAFNVAIGPSAGRQATNAYYNVILGTGAAQNSVNLYQNVIIGNSAGPNTVARSNDVMIGYAAYATAGSSSVSNIFIGATRGTGGMTNPLANVFVGAGVLPLGSETNSVLVGSHVNGVGSNSAVIGNTNVASLYVGKVGKVGNQFVALGTDAMKNSTSVSSVGIGDQSLGGGSATGNGNTGVGFYTLRAVTNGEGNTAVGNSALYQVTTGDNNAAFGSGALQSVVGGSYNVGIGNSAGQDVTSGAYNVFIGSTAGQNVETGSYNVGIGLNALGSFGSGVEGQDNVAIGPFALANSTNSYNVAVGASAAVNSRASEGVTSVGYITGPDEANFGTYVGWAAGNVDNSTLGYNTFVGYKSGLVNTNDSYNTFLGALTGTQTGPSGTVTNAIVIGVSVNPSVSNQIVVGNTNNSSLYVGQVAKLTSANQAFGFDALKSRFQASGVSGNYNVAAGPYSGYYLTNGADNVFYGGDSGGNFTTAGRNTGIGSASLYGNALGASTGDENTAVGYWSLTAINSGDYNTALGSLALSGVTSGNRNTTVGATSGSGVIAGSDNVFIGPFTGVRAASSGITNSTVIGSGWQSSSTVYVTNSNEIFLGNSAQTIVRLLGGTGPGIYVGTGVPAVVANRGSLYLRTDGGAGSTLYVKEADDGAGTGWAAK